MSARGEKLDAAERRQSHCLMLCCVSSFFESFFPLAAMFAMDINSFPCDCTDCLVLSVVTGVGSFACTISPEVSQANSTCLSSPVRSRLGSPEHHVFRRHPLRDRVCQAAGRARAAQGGYDGDSTSAPRSFAVLCPGVWCQAPPGPSCRRACSRTSSLRSHKRCQCAAARAVPGPVTTLLSQIPSPSIIYARSIIRGRTGAAPTCTADICT
jgi:hypothetical protein